MQVALRPCVRPPSSMTARVSRSAGYRQGGGQNIKDVRFLKGVDLGIAQPVMLNGFNGFRTSNEIGPIDHKIVCQEQDGASGDFQDHRP
jgi:hypothetical protein